MNLIKLKNKLLKHKLEFLISLIKQMWINFEKRGKDFCKFAKSMQTNETYSQKITYNS